MVVIWKLNSTLLLWSSLRMEVWWSLQIRMYIIYNAIIYNVGVVNSLHNFVMLTNQIISEGTKYILGRVLPLYSSLCSPLFFRPADGGYWFVLATNPSQGFFIHNCNLIIQIDNSHQCVCETMNDPVYSSFSQICIGICAIGARKNVIWTVLAFLFNYLCCNFCTFELKISLRNEIVNQNI